jgi:hypothetical protein
MTQRRRKAAKDKFEIGDFVEMVDESRKGFAPPYEGTVTGWSRDPLMVGITKRDRKAQSLWHMDNWYVVRRTL